jgi:hypothetical protein
VVTDDSGIIVQVSGVEDSTAGAKAVAALALEVLAR